MTDVRILTPVLSAVTPQLSEAIAACGISWAYTFGCRDLGFIRSLMLSRALNDNVRTIVLVDSDMCPTGDELRRLSGSPYVHSAQAVTGCYLSAEGHLALCTVGGGLVTQDELTGVETLECAAAGLGFAAIHRDSLEQLCDSLPELRTELGEKWWPFCLPFVGADDSGGARRVYFAEDYALWYRLRTVVGVQLLADASLRPYHSKRVPMPAEGLRG